MSRAIDRPWPPRDRTTQVIWHDVVCRIDRAPVQPRRRDRARAIVPVHSCRLDGQAGHMTSSTVRTHVVVNGVVQGVFFRDSCRRTAMMLGVAGWVRNRRDGGVEAVFEGPDAQVRAMVDWCRSGPPMARVERLECQTEAPEGLVTFEIRR
jgi:acylphosphatase